MLWLVAVSAIERPGDGDNARIGIDRKQATRIVVEAVGDRVAAVRIGGGGGHPDRRCRQSRLRRRIGLSVGIADTAPTAPFIHVGDVDRKDLGGERSVARVARIVMLWLVAVS